MKNILLPLLFIVQFSLGADEHALHLEGSDLSLFWAIPFAGMLLSIALMPLVAHNFWHHHYGKVSLFWAMVFVVPFVANFGFQISLFYILEVYIGEYLPFITLIATLFIISGGIQLKGDLWGVPSVNTLMLLIGLILASWMGTTGASMLLIRPLLQANSWRKYRVHTVIFFIFLVSNIGGSLTPLGDPPLFLGFLKGVDFFWTLQNMFLPMSFVSVILLAVYYLIDKALINSKGGAGMPDRSNSKPLQLIGKKT